MMTAALGTGETLVRALVQHVFMLQAPDAQPLASSHSITRLAIQVALASSVSHRFT